MSRKYFQCTDEFYYIMDANVPGTTKIRVFHNVNGFYVAPNPSLLATVASLQGQYDARRGYDAYRDLYIPDAIYCDSGFWEA